MQITVRDMIKEDEYYVGTCTHVNENNYEYEQSAVRRINWLRKMEQYGLKVKVALFDGIHAGFLYLMPIEINPWEIQGKESMVFPCLVSQSKFSNKNVGRELIKAAEQETLKQNRKGIVTIGYFWDFWFMPAAYFLKLGFKVAEKREEQALLWKQFDKDADIPHFRKESYIFKPFKGKVIVDLFWNTFCLTSDVEAQRVRDVVSEFGESVILNEFCADNQSILQECGIPRRIYVNGEAMEIGPEIDKSELKKAINNGLKKINS